VRRTGRNLKCHPGAGNGKEKENPAHLKVKIRKNATSNFGQKSEKWVFFVEGARLEVVRVGKCEGPDGGGNEMKFEGNRNGADGEYTGGSEPRK